ncbi:MAG: O-antigen ligase family protein [Thermoleophilia bacterium]
MDSPPLDTLTAPAGAGRQEPPRTAVATAVLPPYPSRPPERLLNVLPPALLLAAWLHLAFDYGGFLQRQWLLPALGVAALAAVAAVMTAYPRRPRSLSLGVLGLFALYAVWVGVSARWAGSLDAVWDETARTGLYLLVLGIALTFLTDARARRALRYLLLVAALILLGLVSYRLWTADPDAITLLFTGNRFSYPVSYPNNAAALFLVLFWPLVWLATDRCERSPIRALSLGAASGLLCLSVLTQSRGAFWALALTTLLTFILTPSRLRTLVFLLVPAALLVWSFPSLNAYWLNGPVQEGGFTAARMVLEAAVVATGVGLVLSVLERWVRVSSRMKLVFGMIVLVGVAALSTYGYVGLERRVGDPEVWLAESWERFTADEVTALPVGGDAGGDSGVGDVSPAPASRFSTVSTSGRWDIWRVAWRDFRAHPWTGVGAGNFVFTYDELRNSRNAKPRQPHSIELRALSETGAAGAALLFGSFALGAGGVLWPRFSAGLARLRRACLLRRLTRAPARDGAANGSDPRDDIPRDALDRGGDPRRGPGVEYVGGRWGLDPTAYGWETSLIVGFAYWIVHGSVEWLWHMPATTIAPLLLLALAVASVDERAGVMWPRWARFLPFLRAGAILLTPPMLRLARRRAGTAAGGEEGGAPAKAANAREGADGAGTAGGAAPAGARDDDIFSPYRRSDRYLSKRRRRSRRRDRRDRRAGGRAALYPPGPLSVWYRRLAVVASLVVLAAVLLPFLAMRYQDLAQANASRDRRGALEQAEFAARLAPFSPRPFLAAADIYAAAARGAAQAGSDGRGAVLDALALSLDSHERAIARDPKAWSLHYLAGVAALELAAAERTPLDGAATGTGGAAAGSPPPAPAGAGAGTPAETAEEVAIARALRDLTPTELALLARSHLLAAQARNPLSSEVEAALAGAG